MSKTEMVLLAAGVAAAVYWRSRTRRGDTTLGAVLTEPDAIRYLREHPDPTDAEFHAWAKSKAYNVHQAEEILYRLATRLAKGTVTL